jgi:hypothetical protein
VPQTGRTLGFSRKLTRPSPSDALEPGALARSEALRPGAGGRCGAGRAVRREGGVACSFHFAPTRCNLTFVGTPPDPPKQRTSPEPPKRKLIAWIWWKLAEPPPGGEESEPGGGFFYPMNNDNGEFGYRP